MARPRGGSGRKKAPKSKPAKPGKAPAAPAPAGLGGGAAAAFGGKLRKRAYTPPHVSRSAEPPRPRPELARGAFVDAEGRWRDKSGHFIPRATLFRGFFPGSFEDVGLYLQELGEQIAQPKGADQGRKFMVAVKIVGLPNDPWMMLSNAHGLRAAVGQAGGRLRFDKRFNVYALVASHGAQTRDDLVAAELKLFDLEKLTAAQQAGKQGKKTARTARHAMQQEAKSAKPTKKRTKRKKGK